MRSSPFHGIRRYLFVVLAATACAPKEPAKQGAIAPVCRVLRDSIISGAATTYVQSLGQGAARYLVSTGTDSALPDAAYGGLQGLASVRMFPADKADQEKVIKDIMTMAGRQLLVSFHGAKDAGGGRTEVVFSGTFFSTGVRMPVPRKTIVFACDSTGGRWSVDSTGKM
jgi:hypothetical protein